MDRYEDGRILQFYAPTLTDDLVNEFDGDMMSPDAVLKQQQHATDPETQANLTINPDHALITTWSHPRKLLFQRE